MLYDENSVAFIYQLVKNIQKSLYVFKMETGRRFVEYDRVGRPAMVDCGPAET